MTLSERSAVRDYGRGGYGRRYKKPRQADLTGLYSVTSAMSSLIASTMRSRRFMPVSAGAVAIVAVRLAVRRTVMLPVKGDTAPV